METVEVVIRIPKTTYNNVKETECIIWGDDAYYIGHAIADGTILPKNHGRLIDASQLLTVTECLKDGTERCYVLYEDIENAPTILEAEVENE